MTTVQIVGGSHDGAEYAIQRGQHDLRIPRRLPFSWETSDDPASCVAYEVEVYGPATEADRLLGRWTLLRVEKP